MDFAQRGMHSVSLRFAPTVHGPGDRDFIAEIVRIARERGASAYVGARTTSLPADCGEPGEREPDH